MKSFNTIVRSGLVLGFGLVVAAGCASDEKVNPTATEIGGSENSFFPSDRGHDRVTPFGIAQANAAAIEDATIQAYHFDGSKLNSAGTEKLTRLVPDAGADVTVYVNVATDDLTTARRDAVSAFLGTAGVEASHLKLVNGANPNVSGSTAEGIANLSKTNGGESGGSAAMTPTASK